MIASALGSYPRIGEGAERQRLRRAIQKCQAGGMSRAELRQVEDEVVGEAIAEQIEAGLDWVTDGLVRWDDGQTYFTDGLEGFRRGQLLRYFDTNTYYRQPVAAAMVRWKGPITVDDYRFAQSRSSKPVRPVVTGPYTLARLSQDDHYHSLAHFGADLADALNEELRALEAAGAAMMQIDEPALLSHPEDEPLVRDLLGRATKGLRARPWVALYLGSVTPLLDRIGQWPVHGVWLDCVTDPASLSALLSHPPEGDLWIGLGLVDARNTRLESVEALRTSLARASERLPAERLAATTSAGLEFLPRERAGEKLTRLAQAAHHVGGPAVVERSR